MRVLVTGASGQLGVALQRFAPPDIEVVALGREALDITNRAAVGAVLKQNADALINAAAYTDVEGAERAPAEAFRINSEGAAILAANCAANRIRLVHVSTDFVFDGAKGTPYEPSDEAQPLNVYGASKLEGERRVLEILANACIVRTSWVHSADRANFVTKMVRRMRSGASLHVVADEVGAPTSVHSLAPVLWQCAMQSARGIHHWSDAGSTNRFEYARAIGGFAREYALLAELPPILPAQTADFPSGAKRPKYSVLATEATQAALGIRARPWIEGLQLTMRDLQRQDQEQRQ
jgi:dTDP-4-dehydrorhamnose reductase